MFLKTKSGRLVEVPTPEEEAVINAGIAADPDTYELTDEEFARLKPMRGRPVSANPIAKQDCVRYKLYADNQYLTACFVSKPGRGCIAPLFSTNTAENLDI